MERFTHRVGQFITEWCDKDHCHYCDKEGRCRAFEPIGSYMITPKGNQLKRVCADAFIERLAELEDKLESGRLVEQPCKVGDTVWLVKYLTCKGTPPVEIFDEWVIDKIVTIKHGTVFYGTHEGTEDFRPFGDDEYKVNWFTDKAEAEAKLKELRGEK